MILCMLFLLPVITLAQHERKVTLLEDGNLYQVVYFHQNGAISQQGTMNLEGQLHGRWESFAESGEKTAMGNFVNGKKEGKWFFWSKDGLSEVDYSQNSIASVQHWKEGTKLAVNK